MVEDIKFCHIAPVEYTAAAIASSGMNMVLAHIADTNDEYAQAFAESDLITLLDNGAFELPECYSVDKMIEIGKKVNADILVLPDYPLQPWAKGFLNVEEHIASYKQAGFKTMFAPQSLKGDVRGYELAIHNALHHPEIDFVGLSILGAPNAYDCMKPIKVRAHILDRFNKPEYAKKFHMLGMLGSVDEIVRVSHYKHLVHSWDSSAGVWYGLNDVSVQCREEKFELSVDFNFNLSDACSDAVEAADRVGVVIDNVAYINGLLS